MVQHIPQERDDLLWAVVAVLLVVLFATSSSDECATQGFQEAVGPGPTVSFVAGDTANLAALFSMGVLFQCSARYLLSSKALHLITVVLRRGVSARMVGAIALILP
ncbi:unnamed protein product [Prorocentrum cordatum]|uniref:Uncharacterized protein n=1 Tax=Prorocentrum cordatum TaxID=2364126 RepID=A0ABN9VP29_9DINO|nr:unnamed protein product [Polarella glacialis]